VFRTLNEARRLEPEHAVNGAMWELITAGYARSSKCSRPRIRHYRNRRINTRIEAKTTGQFSPTTRYRDYAISPELIHWESRRASQLPARTAKRGVDTSSMDRKGRV